MDEKILDNFRPRFLRLTIVNVLSNIMIPLAGIVDVAFLGHLAEIRHLAGVALATVIFGYLYRTCKFLRMGTTGSTAQAAGQSDQDTVLLTLLRNGFIALIIGIIILLLQYPLQELGFALLSAVPEVKAAARDYFDARIWGAPAVMLNFVLIGWFLGREQNTKVLALSVIGNGANVILDYLFIARWEWGSTGAGVATATSQYLMLLVGLILIAMEKWFVRVPRVAGQIFDLDALKAIFGLNLDIWVRTLAATTTFAIFTDLSASLGTLVLTTNALLMEVVNLAIYFIEGSAFATESLAGNFRGEGVNEKLAPLLRLSGGTSLSLGLTFASMFVLFPKPLFGLLTNHSEVIDQIDRYVLWLLPVLSIVSLVYMLEGYFLGLTEGAIIRNSMVIAVIIGFVPLAYAAWQFHNSQILWLALLLFMVARGLILGSKIPSSIGGVAELIVDDGENRL